jgi:hypothetical protein
MIATLTLVFWGMQFVLFALLTATWFSWFIMQFCVCFGCRLPAPPWEPLLRQTLAVLSFPIGQFLPPESLATDSPSFFAVLTANSLIWSIGLGIPLYGLQRVIERAGRVQRTEEGCASQDRHDS